jgi:hypothetical protein
LIVTGKFLRLLLKKPALFIYLLLLISAGALSLTFFPIVDLVAGLIRLSDQNALAGVVSFAQWILAGDTIKYTIALLFAAPLPISAVLSLLLSGAFGSFAAGMESACGFPAKAGASFPRGLQKRFFHVFLLFYATLTVLLLLTLVWVIAAIPLAVIGELTDRGVFTRAVLNVSVAITALVMYGGSLFLRVYFISFVPSLFSGSHRPVRAAFSFAGHNFFRVARHSVVADIVFIFFVSLYSYLGKAAYMLIVNGFVASFLIFYSLYAAFALYAADGYGFDEYDEYAESAGK